MRRKSLYDHEKETLRKGIIFNTMSEMKLFLQDYVVYHHRPYNATHSDQELRYHVICKNGLFGLNEERVVILLRLQARLSKSDEIAQLGSVILSLVPIIGQHNRRLDGVTSSRSVLS